MSMVITDIWEVPGLSQIKTASVGLYPQNHRTTEWLGLKGTLMIV